MQIELLLCKLGYIFCLRTHIRKKQNNLTGTSKGKSDASHGKTNLTMQ